MSPDPYIYRIRVWLQTTDYLHVSFSTHIHYHHAGVNSSMVRLGSGHIHRLMSWYAWNIVH